MRKSSNEEKHPLKLSTWVQREVGVNLAIKGIWMSKKKELEWVRSSWIVYKQNLLNK